MEPLLLLGAYHKICSHKSHKGINAKKILLLLFPWYERDYEIYKRPYALFKKHS